MGEGRGTGKPVGIAQGSCFYAVQRRNPLPRKGAGCLAALESAVKETGVYWALTLCGTADEIKRLFAISPTLEQYVCPEYRIQIGLPSAAEVVHLMQDQLGEAGISLDSEAENRLALQVYRHIDNINTWTQKEMRCFVMQGMVKQLRQRIYTHFINGKEIKQSNLGVLSAADISLDAWLANRKEYAFHGNCTDIEQSFAESMNRLNEMVGLQSLKDTLSAIFCRIRFNEHRSRLGLPAEAHGAYHFILREIPERGKLPWHNCWGRYSTHWAFCRKAKSLPPDATNW